MCDHPITDPLGPVLAIRLITNIQYIWLVWCCNPEGFPIEACSLIMKHKPKASSEMRNAEDLNEIVLQDQLNLTNLD